MPFHVSTPGVSRRAALQMLGLGAAATALAACTKSTADPSAAATSAVPAADSTLAAAAKSEGTVTFYAAVDQSIVDKLTTAMKTYGVAVQAVRLNSGPAAQRYAAEAQAGKIACDVIVVSDALFADDASSKGWFAPIADLPSAATWPSQFKKDKYATVSISPLGIAINTSEITEEPKDWNILTDPKWQGKLIMTDPRSAGPGGVAAIELLRKTYGDDFVQKMGALKPVLVDSGASAVTQVGSGAGAMFFPCSVNSVLGAQASGAPVKVVLPSGGVTGLQYCAGMSAQAPHPKAAAFFLDFLMTPAGQQILNTVASSPNNTAGAPPLPSGFVAPELQATKDDTKNLTSLLGIA